MQIKSVPDYLLSQPIEFTPVDLCAEAVVKLCFSNTDNTVFHVYNNNFIDFKYLLSIASNFGIKLNIVNKNEFNKLMRNLAKDESQKEYVAGIINDIDKTGKINYNSTVNIKNDLTTGVLEQLDFKWPKIDDNYIKKFIFYLKSIGYL